MRFQGYEIDFCGSAEVAAEVRAENLNARVTDYASEKLRTDGYCVLRGLLPEYLVEAASNKILEYLSAWGELDAAEMDAELRSQLNNDRGTLWRNLSYSNEIQVIASHSRISTLTETLLGEPSIADPAIYVRAIRRQFGRTAHIDLPAYQPSHFKSLTVWIALNHCSPDSGSLFFLPYAPAAAPPSKHDWWEISAMRARSTRHVAAASVKEQISALQRGLVAPSFNPGDAAVFVSSILHGSFDHVLNGRVPRLSIDRRWEPVGRSHYETFRGKHLDPSAYRSFVGATSIGP